MVKFIDIDPKDIDTERLGRRGRVSYPIIKAFMERNTKLSKLDLAGLDRNPSYLRSVLGAYINTHNLPIRIFSAAGELHLMRLESQHPEQLSRLSGRQSHSLFPPDAPPA